MMTSMTILSSINKTSLYQLHVKIRTTYHELGDNSSISSLRGEAEAIQQGLKSSRTGSTMLSPKFLFTNKMNF